MIGTPFVSHHSASSAGGGGGGESPTGVGSMWFTNTPPTGWLICDGTAVSRTTYSDLFAVIGTIYGVGNGTTTFNLPNLKQRFPIGKGDSGTADTLAETGGNLDHNHSSPITTGAPSATASRSGLSLTNTGPTDTHTHDVTLPDDNPPYLTVNFIIKT